MRRRAFIALFGGATAWPLAARAQQGGKLLTIGFLGADASAFSPWTAAFVEHLRELGWIENSNVTIEYAGRKAAPSATPKSLLNLSA
jgi:putative tryptophan/tyrosine transport system substrate-binding protein